MTKITPPVVYGAVEQTHFQYELDYPRDAAGEVTIRHTMLDDLPLDETGLPWRVSYVARVKHADSQAVQSVAPLPEVRPTGHALQMGLPGTSANVPGKQAEH